MGETGNQSTDLVDQDAELGDDSSHELIEKEAESDDDDGLCFHVYIIPDGGAYVKNSFELFSVLSPCWVST
jgi:hypothetical protein